MEFCGYSIPHPSEAKMNVRIQTYGLFAQAHGKESDELTDAETDGTTALEALERGLDDLIGLCDVVVDKFTIARADFSQA